MNPKRHDHQEDLPEDSPGHSQGDIQDEAQRDAAPPGTRKDRWADDLDLALVFAEQAGRTVRELVAGGLTVATKADATPVTAADQLLNEQFIEEVRARRPGDGVLGEEASLEVPSSSSSSSSSAGVDGTAGGGRVWVIDPVDGTQQLILGIPVFMVSIALVVWGQPVVAVAHNPSTGQMYWASAGGGAFCGGRRLSVSQRDGVHASATVNGGGSVATPGGLNADSLLRFSPGRTVLTHRYPWPSVFSGCKVAEGAWEADLYSGHAPWDCAAVALLVSEAGGRVTDRLGREQRYDGAVEGCVLSNGLIHDDLVEAWSRTYRPRA